MRRALRTLLPTPILQLLNSDGQEPLPLLCMSRVCANKIKSGEQTAKDGNDWLRGVERNLSQQKLPIASAVVNDTGETVRSNLGHTSVGYGNYDPRMTLSSYKSSLRSMPPPWRSKKLSEKEDTSPMVTDVLGGKLISSNLQVILSRCP